MKVHTLRDVRGSIPAFIHVSDGRFHDIHVLDMLQYEPGAFYVMDRGYQDFARFYAIHQAGAFFVTRAKVRAWTPAACTPCPWTAAPVYYATSA